MFIWWVEHIRYKVTTLVTVAFPASMFTFQAQELEIYDEIVAGLVHASLLSEPLVYRHCCGYTHHKTQSQIIQWVLW